MTTVMLAPRIAGLCRCGLVSEDKHNGFMWLHFPDERTRKSTHSQPRIPTRLCVFSIRRRLSATKFGLKCSVRTAFAKCLHVFYLGISVESQLADLEASNVSPLIRDVAGWAREEVLVLRRCCRRSR